MFVVGPDPVCAEAIARTLGTMSVDARVAEAAEAVTTAKPSAVVLVAGLSLDLEPLLVAMRHRSTPLIVVSSNGAAPPSTSHLRPIVVTSLTQLLDAARVLVQHLDQRGLTDRHIEILQHLANGCTPMQASTDLGITTKTLNNHLGVIYRRMGANNVTQALLLALRLRIISLA